MKVKGSGFRGGGGARGILLWEVGRSRSSSTLNPKPSTLNSKPSTLNPKPSTLNPCILFGASGFEGLKGKTMRFQPRL